MNQRKDGGRDRRSERPERATETEPAGAEEAAAAGKAEEAGKIEEVGKAGKVEDARVPRREAGETVPLEEHLRLLAEFDNYRKRVERERAEAERRGVAQLMVRLLPLLDDFDRAREALSRKEGGIDREGLLIIVRRLAENLEREGLVMIEASPGTEFDPQVHEAVLTIPTAEVPEGSVAEVLEKGYQYGDRLLRPARVAVARSPEPRSPAEEEDTG